MGRRSECSVRLQRCERLGPVDLGVKVKQVHIPYKRIAKSYGVKEMRSAVGILSTRLQQEEKEAIRIVSSQERKKLIFEKKPEAQSGSDCLHPSPHWAQRRS